MLIMATLQGSCSTKEREEDTHASASHEIGASHQEEHHAQGGEQILLSQTQIEVGGIRVAPLEPSPFSEVIEVTGRIESAQGNETSLAATMDGIVSFLRKPLSEGTEVGAGEKLFRISGKSLANGNPQAAALAELEAAQKEKERLERLAEERLVTKSALEEAARRLSTAQAAVESLGDASQSKEIGTPMKGFLKALLVEPGDFVKEGEPLAVVSQNFLLQLRADVPERFFEKLPYITSANFRMAYDPPQTIHRLDSLFGRLIALGKAATADGFFIPVTFEFKNTGKFLPGSFVQVFLLGKERSGVLAVPTEAIDEMESLYFVYIQTSPGAFERREVKLGASDGERTEIISGLEEGELVVIKGTKVVRMAGNSSAVPEGHSH